MDWLRQVLLLACVVLFTIRQVAVAAAIATLLSQQARARLLKTVLTVQISVQISASRRSLTVESEKLSRPRTLATFSEIQSDTARARNQVELRNLDHVI